jgi:hypothetical protein
MRNVLQVVWQRAGRPGVRLDGGLAAASGRRTDRAADQEQIDVSAGHEHRRTMSHAASLGPGRDQCQPPSRSIYLSAITLTPGTTVAWVTLPNAPNMHIFPAAFG